jgi:hypothetical protein
LFTSNASTVPEAPGVLNTLCNYNLTHDLVSASGVFAVHLLAEEPDRVLEPCFRPPTGVSAPVSTTSATSAWGQR